MKSFSFSILSGLFALVLSHSVPALAADIDLGSRSSYTPYDRFNAPVRAVLDGIGNKKPTFEQVSALMRKGRSYRYFIKDLYVASLPSETEAKRGGDCKAKALWLLDQLNDPDARYVIGKTRIGTRISHAWVLWPHEGRWWVLDCTLGNRPLAVDKLPENRYVALYSYNKEGSYRHATTSVGLASVATRNSESPVATNRDRN
jgi:hypothetical protein